MDVGCGPGIWSRLLAPLANRVISIDVSDVMIKQAKEDILFENVELIVAHAENLPFQDNSFTAAISIRVLEYIPNKKMMLSEIFRILKKASNLVIVTKAPLGIWRLPGKIKAIPFKVGSKSSKIEEPWQNAILPVSLRKLMKENGFRNLKDYPLVYALADQNRRIKSILKSFSKFFWFFYSPFCESYLIKGTCNTA